MNNTLRRRLIVVIIVSGTLFFPLYLVYYQPPVITLSTTQAKTWSPPLTTIDKRSAVNGIDLSSEAAGIVKEIRFTSGQQVKQGDILILLDTTVEEAQLKDLQAQLKLAQLTYERDNKLREKNVASHSQYETSLAQLQQVQAGIEEVQAYIKRKTITAPFDSKAGICRVSLGQYIAPGTTLVTLQSLNPLYVRFSPPGQVAL